MRGLTVAGRGHAALLMAGLGVALSVRAEPSYFALAIDNDYFARADRHYTSGIQLANLVDVASVPAFVRALPPVAWNADGRVSFAAGQRIYTPSDLQREHPDPADRPYAGWTYFLADVRTRAGPIVDHVTASIGLIGPVSGARQFHRVAHRLLGSKEPSGWEAQIGDEVGVLLGYDRAWTGLASGRVAGERADVTLHAGATVGNVFTYARTGLVVRFGSILPDDLPVSQISLLPTRDAFSGAGGRGWYAWLGVEARAVAWNIFLDGNTYRDSAHVHRKPLGYDVELGAAYVWPTARIGFALVRRSEEFTGQTGADRYGEVTLAIAYQ